MARTRARETPPRQPPRVDPSAVRRTAGVVLLVAAVAAVVLSPLAPSDRIPGEPDFWQHLYVIGQARGALAEGQLPIRVAPAMNGGLNYPLFQFYSPLPYQVAAAVHAWIAPGNVFVAYRLVLWAALVVGGLFTWRLARRLSGSALGGALAAVAYVAAPYLLVNVHARSAWTEAIAQGILPAVLWYAFRLHEDGDARAWLGAALSWFALATTHVITFAYGALLAGLLFLVLAAADRLRPWRGLLRLAGGVAAGCALAWWHLEPVLLAPVAVKAQGLGDPFAVRALTPLLGLLSPISTAPPGAEALLRHAPGLHASVGWVMLAAAGWGAWALARRATPCPALVAGLLAVLAVAFVLAWSPVDFWRVLPAPFRVVQFPYRLLAHVGWSGALLVALAVAARHPGPTLDVRWLAGGVAAVLLASASWIRVPEGLPPVRVADVMRFERVTSWIAGRTAQPVGFQVPAESLPVPAWSGPRLSPGAGACRRKDGAIACAIDTPAAGVAELPAYWYPGLLRVAVDGAPVAAVPIASTRGALVGAPVPAGRSTVTVEFRGSARANAVSAVAWLALAVAVVVAEVRRRGSRTVTAAAG